MIESPLGPRPTTPLKPTMSVTETAVPARDSPPAGGTASTAGPSTTIATTTTTTTTTTTITTNDSKVSATWKASWQKWFASSDAKQARTIMDRGRGTAASAPIPSFAEPELKLMIKSGRTSTEAEVRAALEGMTVQQLRAYLAEDVATLKRESGAWQEKRKSGWRRAAAGFEDFVDGFDAFLAAFSGVMEIVSLADNQYGGAATAVLSIFLATVKAKVGNDKAIQSAMQIIAHRLPDLDIYQQIFSDAVLATFLATAYTDIIVFAQTAIIYFQGAGITRVIKGIAQPKKFSGLNDGMAQNFKEVRTRCNALVAERIVRLSERNEELLIQVKALEAEMQELHTRKDKEQAHAMRAILGRQDSEPKHVRETKLNSYCSFLSDLFAPHSRYFTTMRLEILEAASEFRTWQSVKPSSLLVLHGNNHPEVSTALSWLSLATLDLVKKLQASGRTPQTDSNSSNNNNDKKPQNDPFAGDFVVAYCNCDPNMRPDDAMKSIAEQLLEQQPQVLRRQSDFDDIAFGLTPRKGATIRGASGRNDDFSSLQGAFQSVAGILGRCKAPVYLVINRPELCPGGETWLFVKSLLKLVTEAKTELKVLLVITTDMWDIRERVDNVSKEVLESNKLILMQRHQKEL